MMANRHTLHIKHLPKLKKWLHEEGYVLLPLSNNPYEVLRARYGRRTLVVYKKLNAKEHLSYADKDSPLIKRFIERSDI